MDMAHTYIAAYSLTLVSETLLLMLLLKNKNPVRRIILISAAANTITHPLVWFMFPLLGMPYPLQIGVSELFAVGTEGLIIYAWLFPRIGVRQALLLSLACNLLSFSLWMLFF